MSDSNTNTWTLAEGPQRHGDSLQAGTYLWAGVWFAPITTGGSLTVSLTAGQSANLNRMTVSVSEVSQITSTFVGSTGGGNNTGSLATGSTSFPYPSPFAFACSIMNWASTPTMTAGASFSSFMNSNAGVNWFGESSTTVASPTTFPITAASYTSNSFSMAGAVFAAFTNSVIVLSASATSSGMILMPTINNAPTTILSSSTFTMTCCTTNTLTVIAAPWGGNIFENWTGAATAYIQNTLNPTQTITYSSFTTSSLSSTLTAGFGPPSGGSGGLTAEQVFAAIVIGAIVLALVLIAVSRR